MSLPQPALLSPDDGHVDVPSDESDAPLPELGPAPHRTVGPTLNKGVDRPACQWIITKLV